MKFLILSLLLFPIIGLAQNMANYNGNWEGKILNTQTFNFDIKIANLDSDSADFSLLNHKSILQKRFKTTGGKQFKIQFTTDQFFEGNLSTNAKTINGFIHSGILLYHVELVKNKEDYYVGRWNIFMVDELKAQRLYLSVENGNENEYQAYPIFEDNRFTGTWCANFTKAENNIAFVDFKTGLRFAGQLSTDQINLDLYLGEFLITSIPFSRSVDDWTIGNVPSTENQKSKLNLSDLETILNDTFVNTQSILISKDNELFYEKYFNGFNAEIPNDMRSASKSISSAIVGIAKDENLFVEVSQSIFHFLPPAYQIYQDSLKSKIDIQSLLTMSSGLDADDYTNSRKSMASENNYQRTNDWATTVLRAPMMNPPNKEANYGSANPFLLGLAMDSIVNGPLETFMHEKLFQKLGIKNYIIQTDLKGLPYFGGGMYLTPKDMLKFGSLYIQKGEVEGQRILSEKWIEASMRNYRPLMNVPEQNGYGYLWWHHTYQSEGKTIKTVEARGNGGQYIFLIPSLNSVVVITSGNYNSRKGQQPEEIFESYILPKLMQ